MAISKMIKDTLVLTPTLGERSSLHATIKSVHSIYPYRVKHVLIGPVSNLLVYQAEYPWIEILDDRYSSGVYSALNLGLKNYPEYKYFAYINDDDAWLSAFQELFDILDNNSGFDFVYARTCFNTNRHPFYVPGSWLPYPNYFTFFFQHGIPIFTQQSLLLRRSCLFFLGDRFNEDFPISADSLMWSQVTRYFKGYPLNRIVSVYDLTGSRISSSSANMINDCNGLKRSAYRSSNMALFISAHIFYKLYNSPVYFLRLYKSFAYFLASFCRTLFVFLGSLWVNVVHHRQ